MKYATRYYVCLGFVYFIVVMGVYTLIHHFDPVLLVLLIGMMLSCVPERYWRRFSRYRRFEDTQWRSHGYCRLARFMFGTLKYNDLYLDYLRDRREREQSNSS